MDAVVALDLDERLQARLQLVGETPDAAILVEVAVVVAEGRAVSELGVGVGGAIDGGASRDLEAVKGLVESEGAAIGGVNRKIGRASCRERVLMPV